MGIGFNWIRSQWETNNFLHPISMGGRNMLQRVALCCREGCALCCRGCCIVLQRVALCCRECCIVLQRVAESVALCCSVLHCVAESVHCVAESVALCCSVLHGVAESVTLCCRECCIVLQRVACTSARMCTHTITHTLHTSSLTCYDIVWVCMFLLQAHKHVHAHLIFLLIYTHVIHIYKHTCL